MADALFLLGIAVALLGLVMIHPGFGVFFLGVGMALYALFCCE